MNFGDKVSIKHVDGSCRVKKKDIIRMNIMNKLNVMKQKKRKRY